MNRRFYLVGVCIHLVISYAGIAQKKIDSTTWKTWTTLKDFGGDQSSVVSNNGKFVAYRYGSKAGGDFVVIQSVDGSYRKEFRQASPSKVLFTANAKQVVFTTGVDSIAILTLENSDLQYIDSIRSFELSGNQLIYLESKEKKQLVLYNLSDGHKNIVDNTERYKLNSAGSTLLIHSADGVRWWDIRTHNYKTICSSANISQLTFDNEGRQTCFLVKETNNIRLYFYKPGMDSATALVDETAAILGKDLKLDDNMLRFTSDGKRVLFYVKKNTPWTPPSAVWTTRSVYVNNSVPDINYVAVTTLENPEPLLLSKDNLYAFLHIYNGNRYMVANDNVSPDGFIWNDEKMFLHLLSLEDGKEVKIHEFPKTVYTPLYGLSPNENYAFWFDDHSRQYYTYEIKTGITRNISEKIPVLLYDSSADIIARQSVFGTAGWLKNDEAIWIYDQYDIWQLDPAGKKTPVNITKGFGREHKVMLRKVGGTVYETKQLPDNLLISGFSPQTKQNGLCRFSVKNGFNKDDLQLDDHVYYGNLSSNIYGIEAVFDLPQKVKNTNCYVVRRMNAKEAPNLFITSDFKNYKAITDIHPERGYDWMTNRLIHWTLPDGRKSMGILYLPDQFDSTRKYPVIFHFYEKMSDELNTFISPSLSSTNVNIPYLVNNGYIVFIVDMQYQTGNMSESVTNTITSAVDELKKYSWIDTANMGVKGHSMGGYETMVLITRTKLFKAAVEVGGPWDLTMGFSYFMGNVIRQVFYQTNQPNTGAIPWERPDIYVKNSPLFDAENITTPLLMVHNKLDQAVEYAQGISIYSALWRLKKPGWLLQYENEGHWLEDENNLMDFTTKQQQFFDHYLKGVPAPKWMTDVPY